jgi:ATP-dependent protease ClpP protease subunit
MKKESNAELTLMPFTQNNKTFTTEFRGVRYDYYLTGPIGDAADYVDLCNILRSASPQDEVVIRLNSGGGSVATGNMIINAISESEANVIGFIESDCGSMATFIFLACDTWGVSEAAEFFCHSVSYGSWGKEHECFSQAEFMRKQHHNLIKKRYANFLSTQEIDKIILGSDVYLNADEVMERLDTFAAAREEAGCGDPECTECGGPPENEIEEVSLQDIIAKAVEDGVAKALAARDAKEAKAAKKKPVK